jgi:hypothetical protein
VCPEIKRFHFTGGGEEAPGPGFAAVFGADGETEPLIAAASRKGNMALEGFEGERDVT